MSPSPPLMAARWIVTDGRRLVLACTSYAEAVLVAAILGGTVPELRVVASPAEVLRVLGLDDREDAPNLVRSLWQMVRAGDRRGMA